MQMPYGQQGQAGNGGTNGYLRGIFKETDRELFIRLRCCCAGSRKLDSAVFARDQYGGVFQADDRIDDIFCNHGGSGNHYFFQAY